MNSGISIHFIVYNLSFIVHTFLSIDYWTHKCWLAYSVGSFAFGYGTVATKELQKTIEKIISEKHITDIVIGMPYNIDGTMSPHGQRVQSIADRIEKSTWLPVHFQDERLTSSEADLGFREAGVEGDIDTEAARLILEEYMKTK